MSTKAPNYKKVFCYYDYMIITLDELADIRQRHKGQKIVLTSGTFDLLHVGHLKYLEQVKQYGDILVVMLSGDRRTKARKGTKRPIIPENDRASILDALKVVDYVFIDPSKLDPDDIDPVHAEILQLLRPDFYVTDGPDPRFVNLLDQSKFIILYRAEGGTHASTSAIIAHILSLK
jgi:rfaE bifunctional protein nucleotidyltransferase chain/domain